MAKSFNLAAIRTTMRNHNDLIATHYINGDSGFQTQRAIFTLKGIPNSFKSLEVSGVLGIEGISF